MDIASIFEVAMVISFGLSWPLNILKSIRSGTAKGKSPFFLGMIFFGYACGIFSKCVAGAMNYVMYFYIVNTIMVGIDLALYVRNHKLDMHREKVCEAK